MDSKRDLLLAILENGGDYLVDNLMEWSEHFTTKLQMPSLKLDVSFTDDGQPVITSQSEDGTTRHYRAFRT